MNKNKKNKHLFTSFSYKIQFINISSIYRLRFFCSCCIFFTNFTSLITLIWFSHHNKYRHRSRIRSSCDCYCGRKKYKNPFVTAMLVEGEQRTQHANKKTHNNKDVHAFAYSPPTHRRWPLFVP